MFNRVNLGTLVVQNPECKKYIQYSKKDQGKLCFSGQFGLK